MASRPRLTAVQWTVCFIASIGFAFDIYELLMLPLIVGPALQELIGAAPGSPEFNAWVGRLFYIPAFAGGIFGLLGGYLTDRLGRRRVLTWSILIYACSAFAAGFSTSPWMLLFFRCFVFVGVCVEFVAAVAWLAELFPDPEQREKVLGYTQAFSSIGGLLVAVANGLAVAWVVAPPSLFGWTLNLPAIQLPEFLTGYFGQISVDGAHAPWRYTLMSGLIPAIPLIVIRPFLPESPAWKAKREAGKLKRPSIAQLFAPDLIGTTFVTTLMFAMSYGAAFGAIQHIPRIVPGLPEVKAEVAEAVEAATAKAPPDQRERVARATRARTQQAAAAEVTRAQETGGLYGRYLFAVLVAGVLLRRKIEPWTPLAVSFGLCLLIGLLETLMGYLDSGTFDWRIVGIALAAAPVIGLATWLLAIGVQKVLPASYGALIRFFQIPGLILMPIVFGFCAVQSLTLLYIGLALVALCTIAQFSFWGNYLPQVYPMHLRGTGESFAANIGGRLIGTCFAWVTATLATTDDPAFAPTKLAIVAAVVGFSVYVVGFIASAFLPEPSQELTPD
jgi:MFS family permease